MYTFVLTRARSPPLPHSCLPPAGPPPIQQPLLLLLMSHYILHRPAPHLFFPFRDPLSGFLTYRHVHTHIHTCTNSNPGLVMRTEQTITKKSHL